MKCWAAAVVILLAATSAVHTQQPVQQQQVAPEAWAYKIFVDNGKAVTGHEFGTVPKGAQLHYTFRMNNIWGVPLKVLTQVSCDCVKVTPSKPVLGKTETGTLEIEMDGRRFDGQKAVNVFVTLQEDSPQPKYVSTATLLITATSRTDVTLNPGAVQFGIVPRGQNAQRFVNVDYTGQQNWQIVQVPKNDLFDITVNQNNNTPGRISYQVGLAVKADAPPGTYKQEVILSVNDSTSPTLAIPFEITVQPPLLVTPNPILLQAHVGSEVTKTVTVQGPGQKFKITGIEGLGDGLSLAAQPLDAARPVHTLIFKLNPTQAGQISRKITLKTDGDKNLTATITVEAAVVQ